MPSGEYEVAYVGVDGIVDTTGDIGAESWFAAAPDTSPSIAPIFSGEGYEVAFQGSNHNLWTVDNEGDINDHDLGMLAGTSPSVTEVQGGGDEVAFQANTGSLWSVSSNNAVYNYNLGMLAGTSPSITGFAGSSNYQIAFQANTGSLWTVGKSDGSGEFNYQLGMMAGTSPSIIDDPGNGNNYEIAFQANTGILWEAFTADSGGVNTPSVWRRAPARPSRRNREHEPGAYISCGPGSLARVCTLVPAQHLPSLRKTARTGRIVI